MNGESFRISQRSCSPEAGFTHHLFALYVKFLYLPAFRTSIFPMCSLLHRTHSAASPRPAIIPSPLFPALIPILAQVLVVAHSSTRQKLAPAQCSRASRTSPLRAQRPCTPVPASPSANAAAPEQKALREGTGPFDGMRCFPGKPCKWWHSLRAPFAPGHPAMRVAFAGKTILAHLVFGRDIGPGACHTFHK